MNLKKACRSGFIVLALLLAVLLAGCNGSSKFDTNLTTGKDLPTGWSVTDAGLSYDGSERECYYVTEDALANQDFQYATDVSFADEKRGVAALVFQSSEDSKNCYVARVAARTNKAGFYKIEHGLEWRWPMT